MPAQALHSTIPFKIKKSLIKIREKLNSLVFPAWTLAMTKLEYIIGTVKNLKFEKLF
jgi:hypothetical protein